MSRDDLAARLRAIFLTELEDQLAVFNRDVLALEARPRDAALLGSVFRVLHTLKGAASAAQVPEVAEVCHAMESLLAAARDEKLLLGPPEFALLYATADSLAEARERLARGEDLRGSPLAELQRRLRSDEPRSPRSASAEPASPADAPVTPAPSTPTPRDAPSPAPPSAGRVTDQLRVDALKLDALLSSSSQLLLDAARVGARRAEIDELNELGERCSAAWERLAGLLRSDGVRAPLVGRLPQALEEGRQELRGLVRQARRLSTSASEDARILSQSATDIADQARRLRLRPFSDACAGLPRAVRDLAMETGKEVRLEVSGGEVEADRAVLDVLREALLQVVRNAVDHGIEAPDDRRSAGKPPAGTITVSAAVEGDRLLVSVEDDGRGIDHAAIRAELRRRGMEAPGSAQELIEILFRPGVSSRRDATPVSGRGVGLDIVSASMGRLRGRVRMEPREDAGTRVVLESAPSLATVQALLVRLGSQTLAFPVSDVEHVALLRPEEIRRAEGRPVVLTASGPVPLVSLATLLGPPFRAGPLPGAVPVVRLCVGDRRLAVAVDELLDAERVVLQPIERVPNPPPLVSGAALLGTGRVALVLGTALLVEEGLRRDAPDPTFAPTTPDVAGARRRVLVVDDSITTRTLEQSILEGAGYEVLTAVDGSDAWRQLQERECDLIVSDVEMPRMDGFALCAAVRGSTRHAEIPIVLVTALDAPEHRARGLEVGASAYLPKSSFDHRDLLETIQQLLG